MKLQIGDKVELKRTIVDEITEISHMDGPWLSYKIHDAWWTADPKNENILTDDAGYAYLLRFIAAPEPPVRSVAVDKNGDAWVLKSDDWWHSSSGQDKRTWHNLNSQCGPVHVVHQGTPETKESE